MAELNNTVVWVNETQSELYLSWYGQNPDNPLAMLKIVKINSIVTHQGEDYGPCYQASSIPENLALLKESPFVDILHNSYYLALSSQSLFGLEYREFGVELENGLEVAFLLPGDLWVRNSNSLINKQLAMYELKLAEIEIDPFWIYMLSDDSSSLVKTKYYTKRISDFVLGNPEYFCDFS